MLTSILVVFQIVVAILLVISILLQRAEAGMGGAFGGSAGSVTGVGGGQEALVKLTTVLATLFLVSCLALAVMGSGKGKSTSVVDKPANEQPIEMEPVPGVPQPLPSENTMPDVQ